MSRQTAPVMFLAPLAAAAVSVVVSGQQADRGDDFFRTGVEIVQMAATVVDADGRLVGDLGRDDFEIYEDGRLQPLTHFTRDRVPLSAWAWCSTSARACTASASTTRGSPSTSSWRIGSTKATRSSSASSTTSPASPCPGRWGPRELRNRLDDVRPWGGTSIYDAMMDALPLFEDRKHPRAAVVLISDGSDTGSLANVRDVRRQLRRNSAFVYAIAIDAPDTRAINDRVNPHALREITTESGGYTEVVHDSPELGPATRRGSRRS